MWLVRVYKDGRYSKRNLGRADDTEDANGETVLRFHEAQRLAIQRERVPRRAFTVAAALRDYLGWYAMHRKALERTKNVVTGHILPSLGERHVADLTTPEIRKWHEGLAGQGDRPGRATANRILTVLKAALNHAWRDGSVPLDEAWRRAKPFRGVDAPRVRYLSADECTRLMNACAPDFRQLVQAALLTGCRYGEAIAVRASDYNPDSGTVLVCGKSGPRHVPLTDEGREFFSQATAGRLGGDLLFTRADGMPWGPSHQQRPLQRACTIAKIEPAVSFHVLRHSYGSLLAGRGVPLQVIAEVLGHADTRITSRHYAHLLPSYVADTIRANLPSFGVESNNVIAIATPTKAQAIGRARDLMTSADTIYPYTHRRRQTPYVNALEYLDLARCHYSGKSTDAEDERWFSLPHDLKQRVDEQYYLEPKLKSKRGAEAGQNRKGYKSPLRHAIAQICALIAVSSVEDLLDYLDDGETIEDLYSSTSAPIHITDIEVDHEKKVVRYRARQQSPSTELKKVTFGSLGNIFREVRRART